MSFASIVLHSNAIFTAPNSAPFAGFVAVDGNKIVAVGTGLGNEFIGEGTQVFELGDSLVTAGFADTHCFFTGWLLTQAGADVSGDDVSAVLSAAKEYQKTHEKLVLCRGLSEDIAIDTALLDAEFGETPCIMLLDGGESCRMNTAAYDVYKFTPETCYSESYWRLLRDVISDHEFSTPKFKEYIAMMNSRGVTSTKEMGFDDFYTFADVLEKLESENALSVRVNFMSQPVGAPMNLAHGRAMRDRFKGEFVRFSGYNQMTDGSISQYEGEMKAPYLGEDFVCKKDIDWALLEKDALAADAEGFRFSLHAQGDGAIAKTVEIFAKCARGEDGKLLNRHAITDLECSDPSDLERMAEIGICAEVYPQIQSIADREGKLSMIAAKIGLDRGKQYWNRRKMFDSGVSVSCATDLPLLVDDIPESIYHAVGGYFPEGGEPFNPQNMITVAELLRAWTLGGQENLSRSHELGTLEAGKLADIAVFSENVFNTPVENVRSANVVLTICDGKIVYSAL